MPSIRVTESFTKSVPLATKGQVVFRDRKLKGFQLVVGRQSKTYVAQRTIRGRPELGEPRITIGRVGEIPFDEALDKAHQLLGQMSRGVDPREAARKEKAASQSVTLAEAWKMYQQFLKEQNRSPTTIQGYEGCMRYLADWENRPLEGITRKEVVDKHRQIAADVAAGKFSEVTTKKGTTYKKPRTEQHGRTTANACMRFFRAVYSYTAGIFETLPQNPCIALKRQWFPEKRRRSALAVDQLKDWWPEVQALGEARRTWWTMALFTGLRRTTISEMKWADVDLERKVVHIPKPKGGEDAAFSLPLTDYLIEILKARKEQHDKVATEKHMAPWVFEAFSASGHITAPEVKFKIAPVAPHDMRRLFATVAEGCDLGHYPLKLLLNHAVKDDITGRYIQGDVERLRVPMQRVTDRLRDLCEPQDEDKVVAFKGKAKGKRRAAK